MQRPCNDEEQRDEGGKGEIAAGEEKRDEFYVPTFKSLQTVLNQAELTVSTLSEVSLGLPAGAFSAHSECMIITVIRAWYNKHCSNYVGEWIFHGAVAGRDMPLN